MQAAHSASNIQVHMLHLGYEAQPDSVFAVHAHTGRVLVAAALFHRAI
jgi:hypothetical protein